MDGDEGPGLTAGRSRRSTAGNRMRELLEQERERLELKRGTEDDEMFKEEEGDVDFEAKVEEAEDIVDSDFDQSSDDGDEGDDDELQGEREIEEEERIAKKQSRIKAAPVGVRKVVVSAPKASTSSNGIEGQSRPAKRIYFASGSTPGDVRQQRSSKRKSTVNASLSVQARMKLEEKRRQEASERAVPKRKKVRLSQADRIAEALEMEEYNRESLSKYMKLEEERRERDRRQGNKQINGPLIRFRSVAEDRNAQQRMVQVIQDDKRAVERAEVAATNGAITTDPVIAAREAARKERESHNAEALSEEVMKRSTANGTGIDADSIAIGVGGDADTPIASIGGVSNEHSRTTTATDVVMTEKEAEGQDRAEEGPLIGTSELELIDENTAEKPEEMTMTEWAPEYETKSYISLHQLPVDTPWHECWSYILGSHVDWSHYSYVPARNRPLRPRQSVCPITGLAAVYKDPRSGIAFANKEAYDMLTKVTAGAFQWSGKPESSSSATVNRNYEPLEMGCWLDSLDERGACNVIERAADKVAPIAYRSKTAVAPGDELAIVAAAQALPAGTTRSGTRRAHESGA
jgi:vacuolar protein sorting-associated protein 72